MEIELQNVDSNSTHAGLKKKMKTSHGDGHVSTSTRTANRADSSCYPPKVKSNRHSSSTIHSSSSEDDVNPSHIASTPDALPETAALRSQIYGLPIETVAMSRTSPLSVSSLFKLVMQDQPSLKMQRSERVCGDI